jgi:hypothetical protein
MGLKSYDCRSHGGRVVGPPFEITARQTQHTLEIRDRTLDASPEALRVPEERIGLALPLFRRTPALLADGHQRDLLAQ